MDLNHLPQRKGDLVKPVGEGSLLAGPDHAGGDDAAGAAVAVNYAIAGGVRAAIDAQDSFHQRFQHTRQQSFRVAPIGNEVQRRHAAAIR